MLQIRQQNKMLIKFFIVISCFLVDGGSTDLSSCSPGNFRCSGGTCISKTLFCDSKNDCPSGEDELGCKALDKTSKQNLTSCSYNQFECKDGSCIYIVWVCDGYPDCPYGDDEIGCSSTTTATVTTTPYQTSTITTTIPYFTTPYRTTTTTTSYPRTSYTSTTRSPYTSPTTTIPYFTTPYPTTRTTTSYPTTSYTSTTTDSTSHPTTTTTYPPTTQAPITTSQYITSTTTLHPPMPCDYPYERLANRCVFVDPVLQATWDEARYMCGRAGGGDLVILDSLDFYSELIQYIKNKGLNRHSYWVGGRGLPYESKWEWSSGSDVRMGTPLWAITNYNWSSSIYEQEPVEFYKSLENCGYLDLERYHYMDDDDCNDIKATICQIPTWKVSSQDTSEIMQDESVQAENVPKVLPQGKLSLDKQIQVDEVLEDSPQGKSSNLPVSLDESISGDSSQVVSDHRNSLENKTAAQRRCDYPYDQVGDRCVVVDPVLKATWDEARYLCGRIGGGDLVVLDSMDFYGALLDYVEENGLELHDYWVGGRGSIPSGTWKWVSGSTILEGTPLWALHGSEDDGYNQEPMYFEESLSNCGYLDIERYHYMDDADCQEIKAAICQLPTWAEDAGGQSSFPKFKEISRERAKELHEIARAKQI